MKLAESPRPSRWFSKDRRGVALVTVLTVMALTTILVLTFFSLATSEHRASNTYSHGLQAQQVAEEAVNLVIAQIREATTVGTDIAWASQPGSIRQWDDGGNESFAYKLYSDDQMKTQSWGDFESDFMDLEGWSKKPDHFVDLNEPVIRGDKVYYPIIHPAASAIPEWPAPFGDDRDGVEGFSFNSVSRRKLGDSGAFGQKAAKVGDSRDGHAAMPVKWIYQLADGTLGVLNDSPSGGGGEESFLFQRISGAGTASEINPIVARFAFWTDDETCKLNINTHSGGLAWDVPKAGGATDMDMAAYQPAQHEWQRYPGHPATVHLTPALAPGVLDIVNDRDAMEMLFRVVPRVVGGGSESGTRRIDTRRKEEENGLIADKDPLFPTVDDIIMRADREPHEFPDATGEAIDETELSDYLERSKFFITANSRAPETNMFNLPRVAIWPLYNADHKDGKYQTHLTAFDRLIHYCASMGKANSGYPRWEFIFKRENADSSTYDYDSITRNKDLYNYLLDLLGKPVPGYGGSFSQKYPGDGYQQILTEIFDYIRTTNLHDDSIFKDFQQAFRDENVEDNMTYTNPRDNRNTQVGHKGHGQVVPIRIGDTKGMGRFFTLSSMQVHLISCAEAGDFRYPKYFGALSYRNQKNEQWSVPSQDGEYIHMNFPPHPFGFEKSHADKDDPRTPQWLKDLKDKANEPDASKGAKQLYQDAFNPSMWNWQLAYLDPYYTALVTGLKKDQNSNTEPFGPSLAKFNRKALDMNAFTSEATRLKDSEQLVQGALYFNLFCPSIGWGSINPDMEIKIEVLRNSTNQFMYFDTISNLPDANLAGDAFVQGQAQFLGFMPGILGNRSKDEWIFATNRNDSSWGSRRYGGLLPFEFTLYAHADFNYQNRREVVNLPKYNEFHQGNYPNPNNAYNLAPSANSNKASQQYPSNSGVYFHTFGGRSRLTPTDRGYDLINKYSGLTAESTQSYRYDLVTIPFKIDGASVNKATQRVTPGEVRFHGGEVKFSFYHGGSKAERSKPIGGASHFGVDGELIQEITLEVPDFLIDSDAEKTELTAHPSHPALFARDYDMNEYRRYLGGSFNEFGDFDGDSFTLLETNNLGSDPGNPYNIEDSQGVGRDQKTSIKNSSTRNNKYRGVPTGRFGQINIHNPKSPFSPTDVVKSVELVHGDARIAAGRAEVTKQDKLYAPHRLYLDNAQNPDGKASPMAHSVTNSVGGGYQGAKITRLASGSRPADKEYFIVPTLPAIKVSWWSREREISYRGRIPLPFGVMKSEDVQRYGDFDNGSGLMIDGPYINKPDEGNIHSLKGKYMRELDDYWEGRRNYGEYPYFNRDDLQESGGPAYFSPNRLVSGPGMFGSLPTGVIENEPWRTLLFRPATNGSEKGFLAHPGGNSPPDHLIMDLFWMPVVEPYAISEPLSTAGKVNLNFDIVPFLHIQRSTALRGVFRSEFMVCIPNDLHINYKHEHGRGYGYHWRDNPLGGALQGKRLRSVIQEDDTLKLFLERFDNGRNIFKSSTEICEMHLLPEEVSKRLGTPRGSVGSYTPSEKDMESGKFWKDHSLVGDNSRERPYTNIQARTTTKSNTFLVHFRAQVLKQSRRDNGADYGSWQPATDTVQAEYRGSSLVERYVNPDDDQIPDLAKGSIDGLDTYYQYRVVNPRRFAP